MYRLPLQLTFHCCHFFPTFSYKSLQFLCLSNLYDHFSFSMSGEHCCTLALWSITPPKTRAVLMLLIPGKVSGGGEQSTDSKRVPEWLPPSQSTCCSKSSSAPSSCFNLDRDSPKLTSFRSSVLDTSSRSQGHGPRGRYEWLPSPSPTHFQCLAPHLGAQGYVVQATKCVSDASDNSYYGPSVGFKIVSARTVLCSMCSLS